MRNHTSSPSSPMSFCGLGLSPSSRSRSWLVYALCPSPQWLVQGGTRPEQHNQKKPPEFARDVEIRSPSSLKDLNGERVAPLCAARCFGHIRGHASKIRANDEEVELRNKERENQALKMLDQALPEATFTPGIYCLNNWFEFFKFKCFQFSNSSIFLIFQKHPYQCKQVLLFSHFMH